MFTGRLNLSGSSNADMGMMPPHPGAFLRMEILEQRRLNVSRVAEILDERRATVSDILNSTDRGGSRMP